MTKLIMWLLVTILVCFPPSLPDRASATEILIGVRDDARPFVWTDAGNHLGFFWDICSKAVQRAGYEFQARTVDADVRKAFLDTGGAPIDVLCDPTTMTIGRMQNFSDKGTAPNLSFSPIVFVANGTFVSQSDKESEGLGNLPDDEGDLDAECRPLYDEFKKKQADELAGASQKQTGDTKKCTEGSATNEPWMIQLRPDELSGVVRYEVWGFLEGSTIGDTIVTEASKNTYDCKKDYTVICPKPLMLHAKAAELFCEGKLARYFGDAEIMRAAIEAYPARTGRKCKYAPRYATAGTYEPYAFVLSSERAPEFPERFTSALYGMFSDGTIDRLFAGHFPNVKKSDYLSTLFSINSIPKGRIVVP